ncbi:MAG TPA: carboxylating nicotinate-nucleotide diphosphorylase [Victivallales bacterium]|nr:carboxylating nicotinate-nucleotide diphosphorylase [Victivallales bacterium]
MYSKYELPSLDWARINELINMSLNEDIQTGDATSISVIPCETNTKAIFVTREECICAGLPIAESIFKNLDRNIDWTSLVEDGHLLQPGDQMAIVTGNARAILTAERTALNFLQRLSGIATSTHQYVKALGDSKTKILDTRKTTPSWRNLEKYAVAAGGGKNHRVGLYDKIMIKDNHRSLAGLEGKGGITRSVERARSCYPDLEVEVEADTFDEFKEAVAAKADWILLDNMTNDQMAKAVKYNKGRSKLEASGGITLERIPSLSHIGLDYISIGALTHSVRAIDISLEI